MKKLAADWFSASLAEAKKQVQAWPGWKQNAMQVSLSASKTTTKGSEHKRASSGRAKNPKS
jgi:hypothetical protein